MMSALIVFFIMLPTGAYLFMDDYFRINEELGSIETNYLNEIRSELKNRSEGVTAFIESRNKQTMESTKEILVKRVNWAKSVLDALSQGDSNKKKASEYTEAHRNLLRSMRIDNESEGYFFAVDNKTGKATVYPPDPSKENTDLSILKDTFGKSVVPQLIKTSMDSGRGYVTYLAPKLGGNPAHRFTKISFVDSYPRNGWLIGTGAYLDDIETQIKKEVLELVSEVEFSANRHVIITDDDGNIIGSTHIKSLEKGFGLKISGDSLFALIKSGIPEEGISTEYSLVDPKDFENKEHIGYIKHFRPWGWNIISGYETKNVKEYTSQKRSELKKDLIKEILWLCAVLVFIISFSISLGHYYKTKMKKGFRRFSLFFQRTGMSYEHIEMDELDFEEFRELATYANLMVNHRLKQEKIITAYTKSLLEANKKLKNMANYDSMTGIANRRYFDSMILKEWSRGARLSKEMTVAILDVDIFKQYNDIYGHPSGDECLRKVATAMSVSARRPYDLVARYGGEEFVILFPETDQEGAITVAKQISENIKAFGIPHAMNPTGKVTFSMGIATAIPTASIRPETILKKADEMLYLAKNNGRNRICTDDGREIPL